MDSGSQQRLYRQIVEYRSEKDEKVPDPVKKFAFGKIKIASGCIDEASGDQIRHRGVKPFRPQRVEHEHRKPAHEDIQTGRKPFEFEREA